MHEVFIYSFHSLFTSDNGDDDGSTLLEATSDDEQNAAKLVHCSTFGSSENRRITYTSARCLGRAVSRDRLLTTATRLVLVLNMRTYSSLGNLHSASSTIPPPNQSNSSSLDHIRPARSDSDNVRMPTPTEIQSHLFDAFLSGRTADVSLRVRGSWEGLYRLHRVVLIQAVCPYNNLRARSGVADSA